MPATFSIIGLALNLIGIIVLFRWHAVPGVNGRRSRQRDDPRCGAP
jgi:hypothetical protein